MITKGSKRSNNLVHRKQRSRSSVGCSSRLGRCRSSSDEWSLAVLVGKVHCVKTQSKHSPIFPTNPPRLQSRDIILNLYFTGLLSLALSLSALTTPASDSTSHFDSESSRSHGCHSSLRVVSESASPRKRQSTHLPRVSTGFPEQSPELYISSLLAALRPVPQ